MEKSAYFGVQRVLHVSRFRYIFRSLAVGSFLMLIPISSQADIPSALKTVLLDKAFAENLVHQPAPLDDGDESKLSPSKLHRQTSSMQAGVRWLLILPIRFHQEVITHQDGDVCTFQPSCSHYGLEAIRRHGLKGLLMASDRLLRCHSGNHKYYPAFRRAAYDPVSPK